MRRSVCLLEELTVFTAKNIQVKQPDGCIELLLLMRFNTSRVQTVTRGTRGRQFNFQSSASIYETENGDKVAGSDRIRAQLDLGTHR